MSGGVFISYRRQDSRGSAGRIYDRLVRRLGRENVFFDVDSKISAGMDFFEILTERVTACDALVAIIGAGWISSLDTNSRRRIDNPNDTVRIEIEAALERGIRVIPVLVDGAGMPNAEDLPDSLKNLHRRQAIEISDLRFEADVKQLTRTLAELAQALRKQEAAEAERYDQAMISFEAAADRADPQGYYGIWWLYEKGLGVSSSPSQARFWYSKAASANPSSSTYANALQRVN